MSSRRNCPSVLSCVCVSKTETQTGNSGIVREGDQSKWISSFGFRLRVEGEGFRVFRVWVLVG
jgi:hypothetical protein